MKNIVIFIQDGDMKIFFGKFNPHLLDLIVLLFYIHHVFFEFEVYLFEVS